MGDGGWCTAGDVNCDNIQERCSHCLLLYYLCTACNTIFWMCSIHFHTCYYAATIVQTSYQVLNVCLFECRIWPNSLLVGINRYVCVAFPWISFLYLLYLTPSNSAKQPEWLKKTRGFGLIWDSLNSEVWTIFILSEVK